jgi:VanZ like family
MPCHAVTPTILPFHTSHTHATRPDPIGPAVIELLRRWWPVVLVTVLSAPVGVPICVAVARARIERGMATDRAWRWSLAETGMVLGTLPWTWMALTSLGRPAGVSLAPFADLLDQVRTPGAWAQIFANVVFLLPFGALAPLRWPWVRGLWRLALAAIAFSVTLEVVQHLLITGRVASVDDVLQNVAGAVLGGLITRRWWGSRPRRAGHDRPAGERLSGAPPASGDDPRAAIDGQRAPVG